MADFEAGIVAPCSVQHVAGSALCDKQCSASMVIVAGTGGRRPVLVQLA